MNEKPLIRQFSGGPTSAFMCRFLDEHFPKRGQITLFQNTGKECEETLNFIHKCDQEFDWKIVWLEADVHPKERRATTHKIVDFESASRNGKPFEDVIRKYGLPNLAYPHCTRELKKNVSNSYIKSLGLADYEIAIGIRADEAHRINRTEAEINHWIYPLADIYPVNKRMIELFWERQPFTLNLKNYEGNCDLCFKKSLTKLVTIVREKPEKAVWWQKVGRKYEFTGAGAQLGRKMYRGERNARDLIGLAIEAESSDLFASSEFQAETDCFCKST